MPAATGADRAAAGVGTVRSNSEPRRTSPVTGSWATSAWRVSMIWSRVIYINDTSTIALRQAFFSKKLNREAAADRTL
jgi:hypothetical protein